MPCRRLCHGQATQRGNYYDVETVSIRACFFPIPWFLHMTPKGLHPCPRSPTQTHGHCPMRTLCGSRSPRPPRALLPIAHAALPATLTYLCLTTRRFHHRGTRCSLVVSHPLPSGHRSTPLGAGWHRRLYQNPACDSDIASNSTREQFYSLEYEMRHRSTQDRFRVDWQA